MCGIALIVEPLARRVASPAGPQARGAASPDSAAPPHDAAAGAAPTAFQDELQRRLCQRGPDHFQSLQRELPALSGRPHDARGWHVTMHSAVLHLRGRALAPQPVVDSDSNVLCWNGEVFDWVDDSATHTAQDDTSRLLLEGSDTAFLSRRLQLAGQQLDTVQSAQHDPVVRVLRQIRGPFAVAWLHARSQRVYFAHDRFGRRSLLYSRRSGGLETADLLAQLAARASEARGAHTSSMPLTQTELEHLLVISVAVQPDSDKPRVYHEVPAAGVFVLDLRAARAEASTAVCSLECHAYEPLAALSAPPQAAPAMHDDFGCRLPRPRAGPDAPSDDARVLEDAGRLLAALSTAVGLRVRSIPAPSAGSQPPDDAPARLAVLFSGGLDSVVLAALTHLHVPAREPVELLTVCFDAASGFASPDRQAAELAHAELTLLFPTRPWRLVRVDVSRAELRRHQHEVLALLAPCETHMDFNIGAAFWFLSRGRGVVQTDEDRAAGPERASVESLNAFLQPQRGELRALEAAVASLELFASGLEPEDALRCPVARCGRKRKRGCVLGVCARCCVRMRRAAATLAPTSAARDERELRNARASLLATGIRSEGVLERLVDALEPSQQRHKHQDAPRETPEASACRVHRSKQGDTNGTATTAPAAPRGQTRAYRSEARVLLVGLGADEQLAGYGRHRTALRAGGAAALRAELQTDLARMWKRNLGRDDRCLAAHGREARFPFLDEAVVATIASFPASSLCDAQLPRGLGDKRALRAAARALGLRSCAALAKRAIQFGSRVAKVSAAGSHRQTQGDATFEGLQ